MGKEVVCCQVNIFSCLSECICVALQNVFVLSTKMYFAFEGSQWDGRMLPLQSESFHNNDNNDDIGFSRIQRWNNTKYNENQKWKCFKTNKYLMTMTMITFCPGLMTVWPLLMTTLVFLPNLFLSVRYWWWWWWIDDDDICTYICICIYMIYLGSPTSLPSA